ncbi:hypothetical protein AYI69_g106 [Smittium culicis]|uniref:C2H2-type domain-containing protein n=1 Tax=Smittium culicis TaxID=133412 RepID=A0A1R1YU04_9FUNG|nr:hypothetical protein AYI69_g106 [Smittium culicis]
MCDSGGIPDGEYYGCSICDIEFRRTPFTFIDHVVDFHPSMDVCPYDSCQMRFPTVTQMAQHVLIDHYGYL